MTASNATGRNEGIVTVAEAGDGRFAQNITAGRHSLRADEPASVGGNDSGPGPYDLLLAALGACTSMTVRMYAERKGWPLERIVVHLRHGKTHARDCEDCEERDAKIDLVERMIELHGSLDADQRARLIAIAERCPVHQTLTRQNEIVTRETGP